MSRPRTLDAVLSALLRLLLAIGKRVRYFRESAALTRQQLADQTGLTIDQIRLVEDGRTTELTTWMRVLQHPAMRQLPAEIATEAAKLRRGHNGQNGHNGAGKR